MSMNFKQSSCILVAGIGAILTACNNDNANTNIGAETTPPLVIRGEILSTMLKC